LSGRYIPIFKGYFLLVIFGTDSSHILLSNAGTHLASYTAS